MDAKVTAITIYETMFYGIPSDNLTTKEHDSAAVTCGLNAIDMIIYDENVPPLDIETRMFWGEVKKELVKLK